MGDISGYTIQQNCTIIFIDDNNFYVVSTSPAPTASLWIGLDGNKLTRFESAIFKPVLEKMTGRDLWLFMQSNNIN